jgi:hypothetical protein
MKSRLPSLQAYSCRLRVPGACLIRSFMSQSDDPASESFFHVRSLKPAAPTYSLISSALIHLFSIAALFGALASFLVLVLLPGLCSCFVDLSN